MVERIDFHVGYDWSNGGAPFVEKKVHEHGTYIRYSDYEAALARAEANAGEPVADAPKARRLAEMAMDYLHHDADTETYERHVAALTKKFARLTRGPADPAPQPSGPVGALPYDEAMRVTASLAAAISLLERSPKTAAPSDRMFDQMLTDYRNALDAARSALTAGKPEQAVPSGWKLVPEEPTPEMVSACLPMYDALIPDSEWPFTINLYRKLLSVAPAAPTAGGGDAE